MYLYGASGHAKVIKEIIESNNEKVSGFIDDNPNIQDFFTTCQFYTTPEMYPLL